MQPFYNPNLELFKYNLLYKDWCFKQLVQEFDRIDDIVIMMRRKLYEILKIRTFTAPSVQELIDGLYIYNKYYYIFINSDGIVFTNSDGNSSSASYTSMTFERMKSGLFSFKKAFVNYLIWSSEPFDPFYITCIYKTKLNETYYFNVHPYYSDFDLNTITVNDVKIINNRDKREVILDINPKFMVF